jgi:hypothetical protein
VGLFEPVGNIRERQEKHELKNKVQLMPDLNGLPSNLTSKKKALRRANSEEMEKPKSWK